MGDMNVEFNSAKAAANVRKHGITFEEAATVFFDPFAITISDPDHSLREDRFLLLGMSWLHKVLVVVHCERGENVRIISARRATRTERREYEENVQKNN